MTTEFVRCVDCGLDEYAEAVYCRKCEGDNRLAAKANGFRNGAAVAFGLMGMAEAIRQNDRVAACPMCGKASRSRVYPTYHKPHPRPLGWVCTCCYDASASKRPPGPRGQA